MLTYSRVMAFFLSLALLFAVPLGLGSCGAGTGPDNPPETGSDQTDTAKETETEAPPKIDYTEVRISDDIATLQVSGAADSVFCETYAPMVVSLVSDARRLATINPQAFRNAVNLRDMDLSDSGIVQFRPLAFMDCLSLVSLAGLPRTLQTIYNTVFSGSVNIAGRVDFPSAKTISGNVSAGKNLFSGCNEITEIHFATENEETVKSSSAYRSDSKLGAPNATVIFDL